MEETRKAMGRDSRGWERTYLRTSAGRWAGPSGSSVAQRKPDHNTTDHHGHRPLFPRLLIFQLFCTLLRDRFVAPFSLFRDFGHFRVFLFREKNRRANQGGPLPSTIPSHRSLCTFPHWYPGKIAEGRAATGGYWGGGRECCRWSGGGAGMGVDGA